MLTPLLLAAAVATAPADLRTVAEASDWQATATHAEVVALLDRLDAASPLIRRAAMGTSLEGRSIPLAILADPPLRTAAEAAARGAPVVFAFGDIHAGEVCGKEALLMLARELSGAAGGAPSPLLRDLVVVLAPIYNPDGNDRMAPDNRPGQVGPARGMGQRPNAQGLDLNRDWVKLESPEARAMLAFVNEWDPHLTIDTHTTNGSRHRYTLTYAAPLNPSGHAPSIAFVRDELLPTVTDRLRERTGYDTFFYGNFNRDHTVWATYSAQPRFGGPYRGLRGRMSVLSEAYAYAPYRDRVLATLEFVREILVFAAERRAEILALLRARADADTVAAGRAPQPDDVVGIRHRPAALPAPAVVHGYALETDDAGRRRPGAEPADHTVVHLGRFEAERSVARPWGYLVEPGCDAAVAALRRHGVMLEPFAGAARVETYTVDAVDRAERPFQGHRLVSVDATAAERDATFPEGTVLGATAQPLGTLAVYLLEPESADGLTTWNFFDDRLAAGRAFPVHRVRSARDVAEDR